MTLFTLRVTKSDYPFGRFILSKVGRQSQLQFVHCFYAGKLKNPQFSNILFYRHRSPGTRMGMGGHDRASLRLTANLGIVSISLYSYR